MKKRRENTYFFQNTSFKECNNMMVVKEFWAAMTLYEKQQLNYGLKHIHQNRLYR